MKKLKIYLDTSVISYLFAEDTPDKMKYTLDLWEDIKNNKYNVIISETTFKEINACSNDKKIKIHNKIKLIKYQKVLETKKTDILAHRYISEGVLTNKSYNDCLHIASAVINNCDLIISWNFRHLVNNKTVERVKTVNSIDNYKGINIISPEMIKMESEIYA